MNAPSLNFSNGTDFDVKTSKLPAEGWQSVPEPTSGVGPTAYFGVTPQSLLLLGVAGLAFRRRRA